jgi:tetratricopeptide (TPR) repeat protein/class 3 adenylate cyclase
VTTWQRWDRVERIFSEAVELSGDRLSFVRQACEGDQALYDEVAELLEAHEDDGPVDELAQKLFSSGTLRSREPPLHPGQTVGRYRILQRLGGGGMGVVYEARDLRLDRSAALKFIAPAFSADAHARERFLVEARSAAALDHPNICTIYEIGECDDGQLFIAMPRYTGETLRQRIERGPLPLPEAITTARSIAQGLSAAHDAGIVHRDVKPANVFLTTDGAIKLLDFGIAKLSDESITVAWSRPGTVAYMSPEQARGQQVAEPTDVWSLGVVLYEMLAGVRPFRGAHEQVVLRAIIDDEAPAVRTARPEVPELLAGVIRKALQKSPELRYANAREMLHDLELLNEVDGRPRAPSSQVPIRTSLTSKGAGLPPQGDRRLATVVVANLSGYAALMETLAPAELEQMLRRIRQAAQAVASQHEGVINQCTGEQIQLVFGIPVTHEDDCRRALRAALDLRDRIRTLGAPIDLQLHTGIDTGQVITRRDESGTTEYRIAGSVSQVAHGLAALAAPNEILVSPDCHRIASPYFEMEAAPPITLSDRPSPFVPHRVSGETGLQTRLEAAEKAGLTPFTGRDAELTILRRCLDDAIAGRGRIVTVTGEAGMGKSRLLHEFNQSMRGASVQVLHGRCQSYGGGVAYLPFIDVLREQLVPSGTDLVRRREEIGARVVAIAPALEEFVPLYLHLLAVPGSEAASKHFHGEQFPLAMQEALTAILTLSARAQPAVLLLEDWHWVDQASHAVLDYLSGMVSDYPLLVVVTYRSGLTKWEPSAEHTQISLAPLEVSSSRAILKSVLRAERLPDGLDMLLHERTGGNPFFLEEICHGLLEDGRLRVDHGEAIVVGSLEELQLPDTVQGVIRARLDRLEPSARELVRLASVIGREFSRRLLEQTMAGAGSLPMAIQSLKTAGLIQQTHVVPDAAYRFKHILTQEVAYASLLEHQRKTLHGRVGEAIETLHADRLEEWYERLAHHFSRAEAWSKAVEYAIRCAHRDKALSQFSEAFQILERALAWVARLPDDAERHQTYIRILLRQERLCETLGRRGMQQRIIDELISLLEPAGDRVNLAEVYLRQGDVFTLLSRFAEAEQALMRSLELRRELDDTIGERNTLRSLGLLRWHQGRHAEALEFVERSLAISRHYGDTVAIVEDVANLGPVLRALGSIERARDELEEALNLLDRSIAEATDPRMIRELGERQSYVLHNLSNLHRELGDHDQALTYLQRAMHITAQHRQPVKLSYHLTSIAHLALQRGDIDESLRNYREAVELTRKARFAPGLAQSLRFLGELLLGLGQREEALSQFQEAAALFAQLKDLAAEAHIWSRVAEIHEREGRDPDALAAWSRVRSLTQRSSDARREMSALEGLARVARRHIAEPSLALGYYHDALKLAQQLRDDAAEARLRNSLGIVEWTRGEFEEALEHYETARRIFERRNERDHLGLILNSIGVTLRELGRFDEARRVLEHALEVHRETGEVRLEGHALAVLGDVLTAMGDAASAAERYSESLGIRRTLGDRAGEGWMLNRLARTHFTLGLAEEARKLLKDAGGIAEQLGDSELLRSCEQLEHRSTI